ncbi:Uncharacterised protein [Mycobacteroides abscessus subsp. massiliense]|nr:Uncharacterised protein [Mycobacteroides abscessus subsp. massiliense]
MGEKRSAISTNLQNLMLGGTEVFDEALLEGMRTSLARIKAAAEGV